jgi:hypothetical protein
VRALLALGAVADAQLAAGQGASVADIATRVATIGGLEPAVLEQAVAKQWQRIESASDAD